MAQWLYRLGKFCFERAWWVIASWLLVLAMVGVLAVNFMAPISDGVSIPGTDAQKALDRMGELFPDAGKGSGKVVFAVEEGKTIQEHEAKITTLLDDIKKADGVAGVVSPFENPMAISDDKRIAYAQVQLEQGGNEVGKATLAPIEENVVESRSNDLSIEMGGDLVSSAPGEILGIGEIVGVLVALLVLVLTLGSLISAGMPIITAIMAIGVSMGGLFALGQVIDISTTTPVLAVMLGLAVGIDYSLFIISKYRHYLLEGYSSQEAVAKTSSTAGNAVVFAALTVVIALSALAVVQIPFMTTMGLAGAATIAISALVAVTLIPALLRLAGEKVFGRKTRQVVKAAQKRGVHESHMPSHNTFWYRWGAMIAKHPVITLALGVVVIGAIAWPVRSLQLGLPTDEYAATSSTQRKAYDLLKEGFGVGFNAPLLVVAENVPTVSEKDKAAVRSSIEATYNKEIEKRTAEVQAQFEQRAANVTTTDEAMILQQDMLKAQEEGERQKAAVSKQIEAHIAQYSKLYQLKKIADTLATEKRDVISQALPALVTSDGSKGLIQIIPKMAPSDPATGELIADLRNPSMTDALAGSQQVTFAVTGTTALEMDINKKLTEALPIYLAVVVGLSLVLLIVAFRSILVPIKATLGFLLSVLAMFGALVAVFQWGWFGISDAPGPIVSFIPIIAIGILFGLAMDYEFFLVSSMHETYQRKNDAKLAVVNGFGMGAKVVTAAGVIMVAVFAGFITNHDATVQAIGLGLAVGILVDAFIVRMHIVPAIMTLLGRSAWWLPKWLDRIVPHISIEGEEVSSTNPAKKK